MGISAPLRMSRRTSREPRSVVRSPPPSPGDYSGLLPDDSSQVGICSDVGGRDGQVSNFEFLDAIHIEARIDDTAILARIHRATAGLSRIQRSERKTMEIRASVWIGE